MCVRVCVCVCVVAEEGLGGRGVDKDGYGLISAKIRWEADKMRIKASTMRRREKAQEFRLAFREENAGRC